MLTKDLVKYTIRAERAKPAFIDPTDTILLSVAESLCEIFNNAINSNPTQSELEKTVEENVPNHKLTPALKKLLIDRCEYKDDDPKYAERRWELILNSQKQRDDTDFITYQEFNNSFANRNNLDSDFDLYGDLPEFKKISNFKSISPEGLLHRYNCALVQWLLLFTKSLKLEITSSNIIEKRAFFRIIKFSHLFTEILSKPDDEKIILQISGPLSIFQNVQSYGLRLANFFPHILKLKQWKLDAILKLKNKECNFKLDQSVGIKSHYKDIQGYIPEEFVEFTKGFKDIFSSWKIEMNEGFLNLGSQEYCSPDLRFEGNNGKMVYMELFHRWHKSALLSRLTTLKKTPSPDLIIGVQKILLKEPSVQEVYESAKKSGVKIIEFQEFPTVRSLKAFLA